MTDTQTSIPTAPPVEDPDLAGTPGANIDAHMPPQPGDTADVNPVFATPVWNPDTNEWAPSNEQHSVFGVAEPSHGDDPSAMPMSDAPGQPPDTVGSAPDARKNLLDAVRQGPTQLPAPVVEHHHVVDVQEQGNVRVRTKTVRVQAQPAGGGGNDYQPVTILEEAPNRSRAVIRVITTNGQVVLTPLRQGGVQPTLTAAAAPIAGFVLSQADGMLTTEVQAGIEAVVFNVTQQAFADVTVWEELNDSAPGIGL